VGSNQGSAQELDHGKQGISAEPRWLSETSNSFLQIFRIDLA